MRTRSSALLLSWLADVVLGDPQRRHPVAAVGSAAARLETLTYRDTRAAGVVHTAVVLSTVVGGAVAVDRALRPWPWLHTAVTAAGIWACLGGTTLGRTGAAMADAVAAGDLYAARAIVPSLCGRDPSLLDEAGVVRAAVESVAENTSDATVGVLVWAAVAGLPGAVGYRTVNTLDAMIGYRNDRYSRFGWCAARLDDVVNLVPARLTGLLTVGLAPVVGGSPARALRAWREDAGSHPSPNAGVAEATAAGALGVGLGGETAYRHGVEQRPRLGRGPAPTTDDLRRAVRLSAAVQAAAALVTAGATALVTAGASVRTGQRRRP
ncbi:cobalamin biosynthesis protein [Rhodococcus kroppenstedtii]|uniref:cobalamin biosynthesis protein n=1 Tax=Rhodococcoides kroppenstedtii TaxID=293050 RepID=UPI0029557621|nr:cobalamin biosynthesis protein [Rhodococcus kroppenstedtii]MDV7198033.1 cobalamin biosynthesis protein [Rhodococcus kroppenstedtii]